ncbi:phosphoribosyl transferase [Verrucomicrobia bacterium LW23]|nr:phosphoribosyl transferase [Verrucomicrobia bacterium LW23]
MQFTDRFQAGRILASRLPGYQARRDVVVLALPRGGVPVACEVAARLRAPLDLVVVRKIGVPGNRELGVGALASGGVELLAERDIAAMGVDRRALQAVIAEEREELRRRELRFRAGEPFPAVAGRTAILVDDGLATGATMRAAIMAVRSHGAAQVVVAVPVGAADTCRALAREVDALVCAHIPEEFIAVGHWYQDFAQLTDEDVDEQLRRRGRQMLV